MSEKVTIGEFLDRVGVPGENSEGEAESGGKIGSIVRVIRELNNKVLTAGRYIHSINQTFALIQEEDRHHFEPEFGNALAFPALSVEGAEENSPLSPPFSRFSAERLAHEVGTQLDALTHAGGKCLTKPQGQELSILAIKDVLLDSLLRIYDVLEGIERDIKIFQALHGVEAIQTNFGMDLILPVIPVVPKTEFPRGEGS